MKLLLDMNLSPSWEQFLREAGHEAVHWSAIGSPRALDITIMQWARENSMVVFTHDLDFGTLLALTHESGPSVIQLRTQDITPNTAGPLALKTLMKFEQELLSGALVVLDEAKARVRVLPIQ